MAYQTTYSPNLAPPPPGTVAGVFEGCETGICETPAPGIPFGRVVSQGALSDAGVILGGSLAGFRGISARDVTLKGDATPVDAYLPPNNVGIVTDDDVWVEPAVAVAANDPLFFVVATGVVTNIAGAGVVGPVKGCRYKTSCGIGGRALLSVEDYNRKDV
jgi:hypothetical protein